MGDRQDDRLRQEVSFYCGSRSLSTRSFNTMNLLAGDVMYQNLLQQNQKTGIQLQLARERIEEEEYNKDGYEVRMFDLFAEAVEDLYTKIFFGFN